MENTKKTFIAGLNTDDSKFAQTGQDNLDALNARVVTSAEGKAGSLSNVDGTRFIPNYQSFSRDTKVIGSYEDPTTNDVFYFLVVGDTGASVIYCYKSKLETIYKVLSDSNLASTYKLNFNKDKPITGVAYIDDLLYWTGVDGREPFRINVERGIATNSTDYVTPEEAYQEPIEKAIITLIRKPPMLPLDIKVEEDDTRDTSFLKSRAHTFAYRYVYKDGETSVFSPASYHYPNQDMDDDNHKTSKKIKVDFPMFEAEDYGVSQDVHKIQFSVKFDKDTSYFIWKEFDSITHATDFSTQTFASQGIITADFYNDVLGFAIDDVNSIKLYDTVPYEAEALSIARNRLFLGNIKEGRINPKQIGSSDISLQIISNSFSDSFSQYDRNRGGKVGFSHASAYQIGIAFFDFAGRTGGVLTDDTLKIITPERGVQLSTYNSSIGFTLNSSLVDKIPEWAEYYAIVRTKNLIKDFTITNLSDKIRYYKTDSLGGFSVNVEKLYPTNDDNTSKGLSGTPTGTFEESEFVSFSPDHEGLAVGLGDLTSYKQGYTYQEGDRVKLITSNRVFEAAITGQEGRYVKTNLYDFNSSGYLNTNALSNKDYSVVYEIYSPHKIQPNEFYYEAFNGRIIRDGSSVSFSDTTGNLIGDVYLRSLEADTSNVDNYFYEGTDTTDSDHENPVDGEIKYIDFPVFYGVGNNDLTANSGVGNGTGIDDYRFDIVISSVGTPDKFKWRKRERNAVGVNTAYGSEVSITGSSQVLSNGLEITFGTTTGHTIDDRTVVSVKKADGANLDEEHDKVYGLFPSPPNSTILQGSEVGLYFKEFKKDTQWIGSNYEERVWEYTMPGADVVQTYGSIEELFWETNLGTTISNLSGGPRQFSFRRGTIEPAGNGGKPKLHILNHQTDPNNQVLSDSDGSVSTMIYEGTYKEKTIGRDPRADYNIKIDFADNFNYAAESMNPSNDYFLNWTQITGKPNLVPSEVSSQIKTTGIVFSETKIPGGKINGLSKFSALDEKRLDDATGPLRSLMVTSKTQSTGSIMLAISENETSGIYLGEQQLQQASSGGQFLAVSSGVIGTINTLKGSYGTMHPESVAINEGSAFWFDVKNHTVVKYDTNGLLAIGDVKMKTFFKEKSRVIIQDSLPNFVIGTYDDYNSEYIISLPKTGETVVTLQEDPYYPDTPIIDISNVSEEPTTKVVSVIVTAPWNITGQMTVIDGVGIFNFTSPYSFTIPADAITFPTGSSIAVVNASSGGFSQDSNSVFMPGTGSIVFSNVFGDSIDTIEITLNREIKGSTGKVNVLNATDYTNDSSYLYGNVLNGSTPFRITGASPSESLFLEEKELDISNGNLTIPGESNFPWQLGSGNNNTANFTECSLGVCTAIPSNRISVVGNVIGSIGYQSGGFDIKITSVSEDIDSIVIDTRPLKRPEVNAIVVDNITASGLDLNSSIILNRATATGGYGFVYSTTNTSPTIGGSGVTKVVSSDPIIDMDHSITGISAGTIVYSKTYLVSDFGTKYGVCNASSTGASSTKVPNVESKAYSEVSGKLSGVINDNGGSTAGTNGITQRGFVYSSTQATPTIDLSGVTTITNSQSTINAFPYLFDSSVLVLGDDTTYYWRSFAKNDAGTSYGEVLTFKTAFSNIGIGGFRLNTRSVDPDGGYVSIDVTKNVKTGIASGTIEVTARASNELIASETLEVSFTNTQNSDEIQIYVPGNHTNYSREIRFDVSVFSGIPNLTGSSEPVMIYGLVKQDASINKP
tara:strand:- start:5181 stop:10421 length:5241 start_codon:yes stop_codon:yes gene_type:complete